MEDKENFFSNSGTIESDQEIESELAQLKEKILSQYNLNEQEKILIALILNSPSFKLSELLKDFINNKKRGKAIFELFKIIGRLIATKNEIGFDEFNNLNIETLKLDQKDESQLKSLTKILENLINNTSDIKKNLKFTYLLSNVKNKFLEKQASITDKEELLKRNLEVGDIILLNKKVKKKDIGTRLLEVYDNNYDTDFGHAAIIISTDPLKIRHATAFTGDNSKIGYVEETLLNAYLKRCNCLGYDLLSLRPPKEIKDKILKFSKQNLGKDYDSNAAIGGGLYGKDGNGRIAIYGFKENSSEEKDDSYNCVEIIAQALDQDKLKDITHPNEFLEYMNIFTPVYMTTIQL